MGLVLPFPEGGHARRRKRGKSRDPLYAVSSQQAPVKTTEGSGNPRADLADALGPRLWSMTLAIASLFSTGQEETALALVQAWQMGELTTTDLANLCETYLMAAGVPTDPRSRFPVVAPVPTTQKPRHDAGHTPL